MLLYLFSFAFATESQIQVIGANSLLASRALFVSSYFCGRKVLGEKSVLECYDLGKDYFTTRSIPLDICRLYVYTKDSFLFQRDVSSCMFQLILPVSQGKDLQDILRGVDN